MLPNIIQNNQATFETFKLNEQAEHVLTEIAKNATEVKHQLVLHLLQANILKESGIEEMQTKNKSNMYLQDEVSTKPISQLYLLLHRLEYVQGKPFTADEEERLQVLQSK